METLSTTFDYLKDVLYCDALDSPARLEAQSFLVAVLHHLVVLLVPLMPYTAEEVFQRMRPHGHSAYPEASLLLDLTFSASLTCGYTSEDAACMELLLKRRKELNQETESSLKEQGVKLKELDVKLPLSESASQWVTSTHFDLALFLGCATVSVCTASHALSFSSTENDKCDRCWRMVVSPEHAVFGRPSLCFRCHTVESVNS